MAKINLGKVSITPKGEWSESETYERLDAVSYGGSSYLVLQEVSGVTPTVGDTYMLLADNTVHEARITALEEAAEVGYWN